MDYFPLFAHLKNRPVLVVGAGTVAHRKIQLLLEAGAQVQVIAQQVKQEVAALIEQGQVSWLKQNFSPEDVNEAVLTFAATDDAQLNQQVYNAGILHNRLVNVVDNLELCQFIVPAIVDRSPLQIAVSTAGAAPVLARQIRTQLEQNLPSYLGALARLAKQFRPEVKKVLHAATARRLFWEQLFANPQFLHLLDTQQLAQAEHLLVQLLHTQTRQTPTGQVTLVGAGPGDAKLLTLGGLQALQAADVVLYDALVGADIIQLIRRDADKIAVGKRAQAHSVPQENINQMLIDYAQKGLRVVRLKGGDPFVFGRGAEEVEALQAAGINYSIVPGVTAALGATAYAGIPLTHRDHAQTAMLITGHCRPDGDPLDWATLARTRQTLVIYMGTIHAAEISAQLIAAGKDAQTPVAIISQGTLPSQKVQLGVLSQLEQLAQTAERPALIVIGSVVSLHKKLHWFDTN